MSTTHVAIFLKTNPKIDVAISSFSGNGKCMYTLILYDFPLISPCTVSDSCLAQMGMQNHLIRDEMLSASSSRDVTTAPPSARLNSNSSWVAAVENKNQFFEVDFLSPVLITGVTTQGRPFVPAYVTSYYVRYSTDGVNWNTYSENGREKVNPNYQFL